MKKLFTALFISLLVLGLVACSSNESSNSLANQETQEQTTQEEKKEDEQELIIEEAKQEEAVEEVKEEVKEETKKEVNPEILKTYKYWVVFFDHDGNELQREAIKWGTTPTYWSDIPYYEDGIHWYKFTGWKDRWGRDVKEFKPITGNTRFYAQYEIGGEVHHGGDGSNTPVPDPEYEQLTCLTTSGTPNPAYINSKVTASDDMRFIFKAKMKSGVWSEPFGYWIKYGPGNFGGLLFQPYWNSGSAYSYEIYLGKRTGYPASNTDFGLNQESIFEFQIKQNDNYLKVNGTTLYSDTDAVNGVESDADIYVFTQNNYPSGATISANALTIYYFQIYKSGTLVRDFIPVKTTKVIDKSKNANDNMTDIPADTLCMYDKANDMYYLNLGSIPFTIDPIS